MPSVVFLDAAGTLITVREPIGEVYARVAAAQGHHITPSAATQGFRHAWHTHPVPQHGGQPSADDDRSWWRSIVAATFAHAMGQPLANELLTRLFDALYDHYADPAAWQLFDDVLPALDRLRSAGVRLFVLSNFDRRLRAILAGLHIAERFEGLIISSEVGASKPHDILFRHALSLAGVSAAEALHVGDSPEADEAGALAIGLSCYLVQRPEHSLLTLCDALRIG